jgi:hypothetical protein
MEPLFRAFSPKTESLKRDSAQRRVGLRTYLWGRTRDKNEVAGAWAAEVREESCL